MIDDDKEDNDVAGGDYDNMMLKVIMPILRTMSMIIFFFMVSFYSFLF